MKLVTQTEALASRYTIEETVRILAANGFDGADMSLFRLHPDVEGDVWQQPDWREHALRLRELADSLGIQFLQAHAPFASSKGEEAWDAAMKQDIIQAMEIASILGATYIVVHPKTHLPYNKNKQRLYQMNLDFYRSLIPYCEKFGICVCAENMWGYDQKRHCVTDCCLCHPEEFCGLLDEINSPWIVGCLDIGHTALVGEDPAEFIRAMGPAHLKALHVHDVDHIHDCHTIPFMEKLDWESIMKALAESGYEGNLTLEADNFMVPMPKELMPDGNKLMERTGRYLIGQFEKYAGK